MDFQRLNRLAKAISSLEEKMQKDASYGRLSANDRETYQFQIEAFYRKSLIQKEIEDGDFERAYRMLKAYHSSKAELNDEAICLICRIYCGAIWRSYRRGNYHNLIAYDGISEITDTDIDFIDFCGYIYDNNGSPIFILNDNHLHQVTKAELERQ